MKSEKQTQTNPILPPVGRFQMNVNIYYTIDYDNKTAFGRIKNKPKRTQSVASLPNLFQTGQLYATLPIINALAIGFAGFIHVNSTGCLFYHFNGLGYLLQLWDLEFFAAFAAVYPSVGCTAIKQPGTAAFRALGDNLHRYIPYTNSRILNKEHLLELTLSQNILPTESKVIHRKLPSCPIIWFLPELYHLIHKEQKSLSEFGGIFLDLSA